MGFSTTRWSLVLAAKDGSDTRSRSALEELCRNYWYPLYAYVRYQGCDPEEAADLTQAYFTYLLDKEILREVEPSAGRFRSFLIATLRNFLSHEREKERALMRGGGLHFLSLDTEAAEKRYACEPTEKLDPEQIYERRWALTILEKTMDQLAEEIARTSDPTRFDHLKSFLTGEEPQKEYRIVGRELGMTEQAVRSAIYRLRRRFGAMLRQEIAETVADPKDVDDELRHLLAVIGPWEPARRDT